MTKLSHLILVLNFTAGGVNALAQQCELSSYSQDFDLWKCAKSLKVLSLKGNAVKRAHTYGELLKLDLISSAGLEYFANKVDQTVASAPEPMKWAVAGIYESYAERSFKNVPKEWMDELDALSRSSGKSLSYLKKAFALPDFGTALGGLNAELAGSLKDMGCTSLGLVEKNGRMSVGRNLDFAGVGVWDKHPLIVVNQPDAESGDLKTISFGMDGTHYSSITGVNEKGIGLAVHLNYMRDGYKKIGLPLYLIGENLLRRSRNLNEAVEFLRAHRPGPQWTFVLSDFNSQQVLAVEADKDRFHVRQMQEGIFSQSNHTAFEKVKKYESATYAFLRNSRLRRSLVERELSVLQNSAPHVSELAEILGYSQNKNGHLNSHSDILKAHTIQSTLWQGSRENGLELLWIGVEAAPTSTGKFAGFSFKDLLNLKPGRGLKYKSMVSVSHSDAKREEQIKVSGAYRAVTEEHDNIQSIQLLTQQTSAESFLARASFLMNLKKSALALETLEQALKAHSHGALENATPEIMESLEFLRVLLNFKLKNETRARELAAMHLSQGVANPYYLATYERVSKGKKPKHKNIRYEFFAGDIEPTVLGF